MKIILLIHKNLVVPSPDVHVINEPGVSSDICPLFYQLLCFEPEKGYHVQYGDLTRLNKSMPLSEGQTHKQVALFHLLPNTLL